MGKFVKNLPANARRKTVGGRKRSFGTEKWREFCLSHAPMAPIGLKNCSDFETQEVFSHFPL
jgi:hypothetical protein